MTENPNEASSQRSIEVGYQKAIDLWMQEGRLFWTQFNIMLAINALIITIGYNNAQFSSPAIGIVLCIAWIMMISRTSSYFKYWARAARELESKLAGLDVQTVRRGALFGDGNLVEFGNGEDPRQLQMSCFGRIRTARLALVISFAFLIAHGISLYKAGALRLLLIYLSHCAHAFSL